MHSSGYAAFTTWYGQSKSGAKTRCGWNADTDGAEGAPVKPAITAYRTAAGYDFAPSALKCLQTRSLQTNQVSDSFIIQHFTDLSRLQIYALLVIKAK